MIEDPRGRKILKIRTGGKLRRHGLTQLDFESAEPSFDDLHPSVFFRRFPEGEYEIKGRTIDWQEMESPSRLFTIRSSWNRRILASHLPPTCPRR
jgi:hypothetical protein